MSINHKQLNNTVLSFGIALILNGCATQNKDALKTEVVQAEPNIQQELSTKGHLVNRCREIQRDLTIPWSLRQYWCGTDLNKKHLQNINDSIKNDFLSDKDIESKKQFAFASTASLTDQKYSDETTELSPSKTVDEAIIKLKSINIKPLKKPIFTYNNSTTDKNLNIIPRTKNHTKSKKEIIVFAHKINVLGPIGREKTISLIEQVKSSKIVRIRGLIQPDEILVDSNIYREKVSVARALAVRKYWKDNGVDTNHVKILHHDPKLTGRKVEVQFNG